MICDACIRAQQYGKHTFIKVGNGTVLIVGCGTHLNEITKVFEQVSYLESEKLTPYIGTKKQLIEQKV